MAKAKKTANAKEETLVEKLGHKLGEITGAVVEKYNELVHPDDQKRLQKARPRPVSKKTAVKKAPAKKTADPKVAKKAASKKNLTAVAKPSTAQKTAKKK